MIPSHIDDQMWRSLYEISDETGELSLDTHYLLKYEGWSAACIPPHYKTEQAMINYGIRQAPKIWKEWDAEMRNRNYTPINHGHDENQGLYGVTYALYKRSRK